MPHEHTIGHLSQIPVGEGRAFEIDGLRIAVFHVRSGQVFATQARCPHRNGPLADGLLDENAIVCPLHDRIYDLRTGMGRGTDCNVQTYPVRIDANGAILLQPRPHQAMASID